MSEPFQFFTLDDERHLVPTDAFTWANTFENTAKRIVEQTLFEPDIMVSTVFLGLNHRFFNDGPPLVFETMVFGLKERSHWDEDMTRRYSSWDDAETGHAATVRRVKDFLTKAGDIPWPKPLQNPTLPKPPAREKT